MFTASLDQQEMELQLEEMVEAAKGFYDKLRLPYQIKIAPAPGVITIAVFPVSSIHLLEQTRFLCGLTGACGNQSNNMWAR